ncbi:MAG: hypothetical protein RL351_431, partial [Actinomycetota bacterium]
MAVLIDQPYGSLERRIPGICRQGLPGNRLRLEPGQDSHRNQAGQGDFLKVFRHEFTVPEAARAQINIEKMVDNPDMPLLDCHLAASSRNPQFEAFKSMPTSRVESDLPFTQSKA